MAPPRRVPADLPPPVLARQSSLAVAVVVVAGVPAVAALRGRQALAGMAARTPLVALVLVGEVMVVGLTALTTLVPLGMARQAGITRRPQGVGLAALRVLLRV